MHSAKGEKNLLPGLHMSKRESMDELHCWTQLKTVNTFSQECMSRHNPHSKLMDKTQGEDCSYRCI